MNHRPRTALVTGGNRGLGAAIAQALHDAGHAVIVTHTSGNRTAAGWLQEQAREGRKFAACDVDVSDYESAQALALARRAHADGCRSTSS